MVSISSNVRYFVLLVRHVASLDLRGLPMKSSRSQGLLFVMTGPLTICCLPDWLMDKICNHCGARKWPGEIPGICCSGGKICLPFFSAPLEPLKSFLDDKTPVSYCFLENIRKYNSCFQTTSFGADKEVTERRYIPTFKVQGQVYHTIGSLHPMPREQEKFLQIYFISHADAQAQRRQLIIPGTRLEIIKVLQDLLYK